MQKQPDIPELNIMDFHKVRKSTKQWFGATLKNIETIEEQSASGLFSMDGVIVLNIEEDSQLGKLGLLEGDVIIGLKNKEVKI